ncbi:hypothetical protein E4656_09860 [Natronospirillum operosum]|uniref:Uncharacterized protein n=1 Tax=Natronospirillum operosum TaxID=2759953 RepID=A0A4Z0W8P4_9GAMM|nr:hypothetical protein E4656_09860 [Natronospirillum operosum]
MSVRAGGNLDGAKNKKPRPVCAGGVLENYALIRTLRRLAYDHHHTHHYRVQRGIQWVRQKQWSDHAGFAFDQRLEFTHWRIARPGSGTQVRSGRLACKSHHLA